VVTYSWTSSTGTRHCAKCGADGQHGTSAPDLDPAEFTAKLAEILRGERQEMRERQ
jgi:hypothetical protein